MVPVVTNSASNSCPDPISSNCVFVPGPCGPQTLTQQLQTITNSISSVTGCCGGTFPPGSVSAYTGNWIDFSSGIPTSGSFLNGTWATVNIGGSGLYNPQYKWTTDGDLLIRGTMGVDLIPTITQSGFLIPLVLLSPINFPANWTASQTILTTVFSNSDQSIYQTGSCLLQLDFPTGLLSLNIQFIDLKLQPVGIYPINLSARFNNA